MRDNGGSCITLQSASSGSDSYGFSVSAYLASFVDFARVRDPPEVPYVGWVASYSRASLVGDLQRYESAKISIVSREPLDLFHGLTRTVLVP